MGVPAVSLARKISSALAALVLAFSLVPTAWADGAPALPAGSVAGSSQEQSSDGESAPGAGASSGRADDAASDAPEASAQSASTAAADGSAGGTTVKIAVYRSSYQLAWDLNDEHGVESLMATWADGTREAPDWWEAIQGSPGSQVECPPEYTRDAEPKRTGYSFLGWSTDPAAPKGQMLDELAIPEDAEIAGEGDARSIALYAIWTPIEYSVVFDLAKNPEDASAAPAFAWTTGKGEFADLGGGRYRLHGITLDDYDPATGLIEIATPSRGTGGYRFLSWAEPESQQDPSVAMRKSGTSKWFVNPVALPHYDYEPVLTARWGLSFDVDVPSQITFDEYDSLEVEGSLTDSTSKEDVDEESPDAHDRGKQAHFCSQSTVTDYRIVALKSVRAATADDVLTTSDSTKATHEQVLGSERLLSMFASADRSESAGVHFRLDDEVDMDSARYSSFVIPKQQAGFDPSATDRDAESRLYVSYRLNLDNRVDGASEPNHGLVAAGNVADGVRTRIASVSYEFAVADHEVVAEQGTNSFYIEDDGAFYGLDYIKRAAEDISANGTSSQYYAQFKGYLDAQITDNGVPGPGPYFKLKLNQPNGTFYIDMQLIGICQDFRAEGTGKAGLSFQALQVYTDYSGLGAPGCNIISGAMNPSMTSSSDDAARGWVEMPLRAALQDTFKSFLDSSLRTAIVPVRKNQQIYGGTTADYLQSSVEDIWLPSMYEVYGTSIQTGAEAHAKSGYSPFQYAAYQGNNGNQPNLKAARSWNGQLRPCWMRSAGAGGIHTNNYWFIDNAAQWKNTNSNLERGVAPCFCL